MAHLSVIWRNYAQNGSSLHLASAAELPKVITVAEAAERLGVHDRTVRKWIREGRLKPYRVMGDRRRYVSADEVEALKEPRELDRESEDK